MALQTQGVVETIQLVLAPVVLVSACAVLLGGLLNRYAGSSRRLREMAHERMALVRAVDAQRRAPPDRADPFTVERMKEIDVQVPQLLRRHRYIRHAVLAIYGAVAVFVTSMFLLALAAYTGAPFCSGLALALFLAGTAVLLLGVLFAGLEIALSQGALAYEVEQVSHLVDET